MTTRISDDVLAVMYDLMAHFDFCPVCRNGLDTGLECDKCGADFMPIQEALSELQSARKRIADLERLARIPSAPSYTVSLRCQVCGGYHTGLACPHTVIT